MQCLILTISSTCNVTVESLGPRRMDCNCVYELDFGFEVGSEKKTYGAYIRMQRHYVSPSYSHPLRPPVSITKRKTSIELL